MKAIFDMYINRNNSHAQLQYIGILIGLHFYSKTAGHSYTLE